jgi:hypothetical protein
MPLFKKPLNILPMLKLNKRQFATVFFVAFVDYYHTGVDSNYTISIINSKWVYKSKMKKCN